MPWLLQTEPKALTLTLPPHSELLISLLGLGQAGQPPPQPPGASLLIPVPALRAGQKTPFLEGSSE